MKGRRRRWGSSYRKNRVRTGLKVLMFKEWGIRSTLSLELQKQRKRGLWLQRQWVRK